uniref:hypothetical protein n=1 Tax=Ningiella ruwaisensis TaxID=2364274 RepID=UPI0010A09F7F|nr:hypothetical protein [Ningiella ruwaisensis]
MEVDLNTRIQRLETANRVLFIALVVLFLFVVYILLSSLKKPNQSTVEVSELVVLDSNGIVRARLSGDMPNAMINGKEIERGNAAAGLMLYDQDGQERGGYLTFSNDSIALTLDSKEKQTALFVSGGDGGSALHLWDDNSAIELRSDSNGSRLTSSKLGTVVAQLPEILALSGSSCAEYRSHTVNYPAEEVFQSCRKRFNEEACKKCFEGLIE